MKKREDHQNESKFKHYIIEPIKTDFEKKDIIQIITGATILSIPVGFTEETWNLGEVLPLYNIIAICILSLLFISIFTYYHYHHKRSHKAHLKEFSKRLFFTYLLTLLIVGTILSLIQKAPWSTDLAIAIKRVVIVSLPASMSAVVADTIK